jgi:uncharacterized membrane-anchored protein YhcB (DUF1043 family)
MLGYDRLAPQGEKVLQMTRQALNEAHNFNNPIVASTAALVAGVFIGVACSRLLASPDDEVKRLRAEANDLVKRIDSLPKARLS